MESSKLSTKQAVPLGNHAKSKKEFKRDSLTRFHQFNNLLVYYLSNRCNVYVKRFFKPGNKIIPFLLVSHIEDNGKEIYRYDTDTEILQYISPETNETVVLKQVRNLDSDIHRRQVNILIEIANEKNFIVKYTKAPLRNSRIRKNNIVVIDFHDNENKQHVITTDNIDNYYKDIENDINNQMNTVIKPKRLFLLSNKVFVYQLHESMKMKYIEKILKQQELQKEMYQRKNEIDQSKPN